MTEYSGWEKISPAEAWGDETGFNNWLHKEGLELLSKELGFTLLPISREYNVGTFRSDLLVELEGSKKAVIESQFGRSNHVHYGELLTYYGLEGVDKSIWICEESCKEHIESLIKLNRNSKSTVFYLVSFKVGRLGSQIIVDFQIEVPRTRRISGNKVDADEGRAFWTSFLEKASKYSSRFRDVRPWKGYALGLGTGLTGVGYAFWLNRHEASIGFYVYFGPDKVELSKQVYSYLETKKSHIGVSLSSPLVWDGIGKQAVIKSKVEDFGYQDRDSWDKIQESMLKEFLKLERSLTPIIEEVKQWQS